MPPAQAKREMALDLASHQPPLDLRDLGVCMETLLRLDWPVRVLMWWTSDAMRIAREIRSCREGSSDA